jgi:hypothetical protein
MGRYYSGDIKGKFWFGVQSSDDASFFGGRKFDPGFVEYVFDKDHDYETVCKGVETCRRELGDYKEKLDEFFEETNLYDDTMVAENLKVNEKTVSKLLEWYARLELGEKIKQCLERKDSCSFQAELE